MDAVRRDGEAERRQPRPRDAEVGDRQHDMVERSGAGFGGLLFIAARFAAKASAHQGRRAHRATTIIRMS